MQPIWLITVLPGSRSQTSGKSFRRQGDQPTSTTGAPPQPATKQPSPGQPLHADPQPHPRASQWDSRFRKGCQFWSSEDLRRHIRTETLAKEIIHQDKSLADILDPDSRMKTTMDLMEGLFPRDVNLLKENSIKKKAVQKTISFPGCETKR